MKQKNLKNKKVFGSKQAGVTLLLAILVLSAIMAISFSLSTILFVELRTSGDLTRTEGALFAANGIAEQELFNLQRHFCTYSTSGNCTYTTSFSNNVSLRSAPVISSTSTPIFQVRVPANSSFALTANIYNFCDASNGISGCKYGKVQVTYLNPTNNPLKAYLCQFDPSGNIDYNTPPCSNPVQESPYSYWAAPDSGTLNTDGSVTLNTTNPIFSWSKNPGGNLNPTNLQQELILTNAGSTDIFASIKTYAADGVTPKGLPLVNMTAVDVNAVNGQTGRKVRIVVPNQ